MKINIKFILISCACLILAFFGHIVHGQDTSFQRIQLPYGISLEIPSHWMMLSEESRRNLSLASESILNQAGLEDAADKAERLLAVTSTPSPPGVKIRVSTTAPYQYTQADFAAVSPADLNELRQEFYENLKKMEASGGIKVQEVEMPRVEVLNNQISLVLTYTRSDFYGPSSWQVTQYKVPVSGRLIEFTLSYRQSDAAIWKPIIENIKRSIRF